MSYIEKAREPVGTIERGELYRELTLISDLLEMTYSTLPDDEDGGIGAGIKIAKRMAENLAGKVSP